METAFIIALAFLPVLVLLLYIRHKDRRRPEPLGRLLLAFGLGWVAVPLSLCMSVPFGMLGLYPEETVSFSGAVCDAFFAAAIPEELAKLFLLWLLLRRRRHFDEHMDGIVYAVFVSLGFAAPENLMYLFSEEDYLATGIARALFSIPGHCCFGILMGYYYSLLAFSPCRRGRNRAMLFIAPIAAHGVYDALLFVQELAPEFVGGLLLLAFVCFCAWMWRYCHYKIEQHLRRDESFLAQPPPLPWFLLRLPPLPWQRPCEPPPLPGKAQALPGVHGAREGLPPIPPALPPLPPAAQPAAQPATPPTGSPALPPIPTAGEE